MMGRFTGVCAAAALSVALAAPVLPGADVASSALQSALTVQETPTVPAPQPVAAQPAAVQAAAPAPVQAQPVQAQPVQALAATEVVKAKPVMAAVKKTESVSVAKAKVAKAKAAAAAKAAQVAAKARAQGVAAARKVRQATMRPSGKSAVVRATAYNSAPNQTDSTPWITATGTRTRFGVVALSRDLLARFPYGTKLKIEDLSGRYQNLLAGQVFVVEDTMHPRMRGTVDVWMSSRGQALRWGGRSVRITELR